MEYFDPKFAEMESSAREALAKWLYGTIEAKLIEKIEIIEGRVPSNEEVVRYGRKTVYPNGDFDMTWRGITIIKVHLPRLDEPFEYKILA